jgi:hypothetical protein
MARDTLIDVSSRHPDFYRRRALEYDTAYQKVDHGLLAGGRQTVLTECGNHVLDSLKILKQRASALASRTQ